MRYRAGMRILMITACCGLLLASCASPDRDAEAGAWIDLFDGRTLDGWTTTGGRYDGHAAWTVEDGTLTGREGPDHAGGLIYTQTAWADFEFTCETRIVWPFDSGIFLRMTPEAKGAQVTLDYRPGGEVGGIYSDGWYAHQPDGASRFRRDGWNAVHVRCEGNPMHVTVWLDGALLTDYTFPAEPGFARTGLIGLQVHGSSDDPPGSLVRFRNIRARKL